MAYITFENVIYDRVLTPLRDLLDAELPDIPVNFDEHTGPHSILVVPNGDSLIDVFANGQGRTYSANISYRKKHSNAIQFDDWVALTNMAEHIKRLLHDNRNYSPSGTYKFHDGQVGEVTYSVDAEDIDYKIVTLEFECTSTELIG